MTLTLLELEEPMPGWCPNASKLGGLPNCAHDPRKLVPLSKMITKNVPESKSGIIARNDVV